MLVDEYRTTLTGLTPDEARALFMMSIPGPLAQLGVGQELKTAMLKLSAALPEARRGDELRARQRILLDSSWWFQADEAMPCLQTILQGIWNDRMLDMTYTSNFNAQVVQLAAPYGLVAKANIWHLVCHTGGSLRVLRVSQVVNAVLLEHSFIRPADFNLAVFWEKWCAEYELQPPFVARVRVSPELLKNLKFALEERFQQFPTGDLAPDRDGWVILDLPFASFFSARTRLLGLGRAVEVLEPEPLRKSIIDFANQVNSVLRADGMSPFAILLVTLSAFSHAFWNYLSKRQNPRAAFFLMASIASAGVLTPTLIFLRAGLAVIPPVVWGLIAATGAVQSLYYIFLAAAYRNGDLSHTYPLTRSLPVVIIAMLSVALGRGNQIHPLAYVGFAAVSLGCLILPLPRLRDLSLRHYRSKWVLYAVLAALCITAYTLLDDQSLKNTEDTSGDTSFQPRLGTAFWRIGVHQYFILLCHLPARVGTRTHVHTAYRRQGVEDCGGHGRYDHGNLRARALGDGLCRQCQLCICIPAAFHTDRSCPWLAAA